MRPSISSIGILNRCSPTECPTTWAVGTWLRTNSETLCSIARRSNDEWTSTRDETMREYPRPRLIEQEVFNSLIIYRLGHPGVHTYRDLRKKGVPIAVKQPLVNTTVRSAIWSISSIWWVVMIIQRPTFINFRTSQSSLRATGSKPAISESNWDHYWDIMGHWVNGTRSTEAGTSNISIPLSLYSNDWPEDGSSRNSTRGFPKIEIQTDRRRRWPPLNLLTRQLRLGQSSNCEWYWRIWNSTD